LSRGLRGLSGVSITWPESPSTDVMSYVCEACQSPAEHNWARATIHQTLYSTLGVVRSELEVDAKGREVQLHAEMRLLA
jgi:hypothetical protein